MNTNLHQLMNAVIFITCAIPVDAFLQTIISYEKGTLRGHVYSVFDTTQSLPGANVMLFKNDSLYTEVAADKKGNYIFSQIPHGEYLLRATYIVYEDARIDISIKNSDTMYVNIAIGKILPATDLPFSEYDAKDDIANGKVELLTWGLQPGLGDKVEKKLMKLRQRYGFDKRNLGCLINPELIQAIERYNKEVRAYLDKRNGSDWYQKYFQEQSKIIKRR